MRKVPPLTAEDLGLVESAPEHRGRNVIYFGPPGVGKSYRVREEIKSMGETIRVTFHPEYSHGRFVGTYQPVVGHEKKDDDTVTGYDGEEIGRPVSYFDFVPGPMTRALVVASSSDEHVVLVIEEINRGDCAAIFGDFFQLLDRDKEGKSEYPLSPTGPLEQYLDAKDALSEGGTLRIPPNLSLFATMNTSDQSLFPMDSAFKRRWEWKAVPLMSGAEELAHVEVRARTGETVAWLDLIEVLNEKILETTQNEDKQVGPWYVRKEAGVVNEEDIRNKLLHYIWHDVFTIRRERKSLFDLSSLLTFDNVQQAYDKAGGIFGVLKTGVADEVRERQNEREGESSEQASRGAASEEAENTAEEGGATPADDAEA